MAKKDGGGAFPMQFLKGSGDSPSMEDGDEQFGMSLRDYFAGQAATEFCFRPEFDVTGSARMERFAKQAKDCYLFADAMIAARSQAK